MTVLLAALAILLSGGVLALAASRSPSLSSALGAASAVAGCALGELHAFRALRGAAVGSFALAWHVPYGELRVATDALSGFFLVPVFGIGALAAVYGVGYLAPYRGRRALGPLWFAFNVFLAAMALVVVARQAVLFLVAWEIMSLASFVLVSFENERAEVARAGLVYLVASHVGAVLLLAFFVLLGNRAGGFDFDALQAAPMSRSSSALLFCLALCGFGIKAGLVPLHVWLPEAHAAAPSHVSALMSAVLIKMGVYGILRSLMLLRDPLSWAGPPLVAVGVVTALVAIALASYQRDVKRVLAYSSIENVGVIALGFGTALWGWSAGRREMAVLALAGALLHVWNHALMKALMFFGAGSVLHGCGTRDLEKLGGVLKRMPLTGSLLVVGGVAIAALPPLNGFVGEWLVYLSLIQQAVASRGATSVMLLLAVGALSVVGALALFTFVRLLGVALLGQPRGASVARAHESPMSMIGPMAVLAASCVGVALAPGRVLTVISGVIQQLLGPDAAFDAWAPTRALAGMNAAVLVGAMILGAALAVVTRSKRAARAGTWGCGYARPTARMQYTARAFSELLEERLVPRLLRARQSPPGPAALFPQRATFATESTDPITRGVYEPLLSRWADRFARLRWIQQGLLHLYLLYMLCAVVALLGWVSFLR